MIRSDRQIALGAVILMLLALAAFFWLGRSQPATDASAPDVPSQAFRSGSRSPYYSGSRSPYYSGSRVPLRSGSRSQPVYYDATPSRRVETFPFDPNTADSTQLLRLGLQPWQVRNIYKYRARGGVYRRKEDFARLYGLTVKDYRRLEPYIRISADYQPAATLLANRQPTTVARDTLRRSVKLQPGQCIVLNTADSAQLQTVPGIGTYYAREILRYGRWLGGYVSVDQLDEIDGFPEESKPYFVVRQPSPHKLNINRLSLPQLRRHPYINFYQAKAIVDYRRLRGPISSLHDLRLSPDFPPEAIRRLEPYVEY